MNAARKIRRYRARELERTRKRAVQFLIRNGVPRDEAEVRVQTLMEEAAETA